MNSAEQAELDRIVSVPVGLSHLPDPADVTEKTWREIAAGALPLEDHVSSHIVEPLLRFALGGTDLTWRREYPVGRRWADFVILDGARPLHVIEVKKVIRAGQADMWSESPDLQQLRWYASQLGTGGTLIDSNRVVLLPSGTDQPKREIRRRDADRADLEEIRQHLLAG